MFEIRPVWYLPRNFFICGFASLKAPQRATESGRNPDRDGSSGQPISLAILTAAWRRTSA